MSNIISEFAEVAYQLPNKQQVRVVIRSLPNDYSHIKMVLS